MKNSFYILEYAQILYVKIVFVNAVLVPIIHLVHVKQQQVPSNLHGDNELSYHLYSLTKHEIIYDVY